MAMYVIGLIKEGKVPADRRVALTPDQCKWIQENNKDVKIVVEPCETRCFSNAEYKRAGVTLTKDLSSCHLLMGIKEVPADQLMPGKNYMFFSHTKKKQPHNQQLMQAMLAKKISLIDYECMEHTDGQRILGFGFFAGIVGAHNGMMAYGNRTGLFSLGRVYKIKDYRELIHSYFGLRVPNVKIAVAGSGRVGSGVLEVMNLMGIIEVEPSEFLSKKFDYPVYVHLKGQDLYEHKITGKYDRDDFHENPKQYKSRFKPYVTQADILMNGVYWEKNIPRLFEWEDTWTEGFSIQTIADITDDKNGSVPINLGDSSIEYPVYGVDVVSRQMIDPYQESGIDIMAVSNLPNELPRDASRYFGEQILKYVLEDILKGGSEIIDRATMIRDGKLTENYQYLQDYADGIRS
jgi:saccharopine dehydrogenase (NAD+, L-lysine forming)